MKVIQDSDIKEFGSLEIDEDRAKSQAHSAAWAEWKRNNPTT